MFELIKGVGTFLVKEVADWSRRRDSLKEVQLEAEVAEIRARAEIAAYKVKADIEWDLAWAGQAQSSWKDEFILILWTIPMLAFLPSLFFSGAREGVQGTLEYLQALGGPDVLKFYISGWAVIFAATFGMKSVTQMMLPGSISKITEAFSSVADDVPEAVAKTAQSKVSSFMEKVRSGKL
jgi:hypothetical protein